ncbi:VCBS repeat-containing protein [Pseudenhygromyxa sp. WMMC2535]|uniref:FG-GAP repeat domain-containing protein n=1 Tax=Pseudenhygromyxa sp. WMMC2535 TaxID=2712867 RepID=UPI001551C23A|nr:VCBS repeat-containing protein [Pseudenhygromyxa sp. WMMC2535]NVB37048.1 VCBS repeat-containing protein [Pseudenhygromyxa sp. WMMC2535]
MTSLQRTITTQGLTLALALTTSLTAGTAHADPIFELIDGALDPQACGGAGCWTNHMRVTDIDNDGDLDLLFANYADFFGGDDSPQPLVVYLNDGAANFSDNSSAAFGNYEGNLRQIAVGDVDGDGAPDIYAPSGSGDAHVLFINDGSGLFVDEADARLPDDYPAGAAARMADVDNDGDLDIFAADAYAGDGPPYGRLYINDGAGVFTEAEGALPVAIAGQDIDDVEFFDADRDFDLDLVVNAHSGGIGALWLNDGSGVFTAGGSLAAPATGNFHYNVAPCDVDGDGDLDLWIDNIGGSFTEQLQINDGTGVFSDETDTRVSGNPGADDNGVACVDLDDDGDLDGVVLSLASAERLLENDGAGNFSYVADTFPPPTDCTLWGEFGDLDGDARVDLVTAQGECSSSNEVYLAGDEVPVDSRAPVIVATEGLPVEPPAEGPTLRFAVADRTLSDEGPRLARAYAVIDPEGVSEEFPAWYMGGDLYRVVLPTVGEGEEVVFELCAEDRAGNIGCGETQSYEMGAGETSTDTDTDTETTGTDTDTETTGTDTETTGTDTDSETGTETETGSETGTETETGSETGTETETGSETGTGSESDSGEDEDSSGSADSSSADENSGEDFADEDSEGSGGDEIGADEGNVGIDDGCNCSSAPARPGPKGALGWLALAALGMGLRRRRDR